MIFPECHEGCGGGSRGQSRCTGLDCNACCSVYVDDMCDTACPTQGLYILDEEYTCGECIEPHTHSNKVPTLYWPFSFHYAQRAKKCVLCADPSLPS